MHRGLTELLSDAENRGRVPGDQPAFSSHVADDVSGGENGESFSSAIQQATQQIQQLQTATTTNSDPASNINALSQSTQSQNNSSGGDGGTVGQIADSLLSGSSLGGLLGGGGSGGGLGGLLGGLFGSIPLLSGLASLFGGGSDQPAPLVQYQAPDSQNFEEALSGGVIGDAVYGATGQPRSSSITEQALQGLQGSQSAAGAPTGSSNSSQSPSSQSSQQVTVQVNAMDSQSFMDRAGDIASAVRSAMLNMHSINDVVTDL
jgi:hypothetical protein